MNTILIIDDEQQICRFLRSSLEESGFKVYDADNLRHGLSTAVTRQPDLVILDLGLPDGDGLEFIRQFRQWSDKPILVLSARTGEGDKIEALDAGADDFLSKPFGLGELQARVRVAFRRQYADKAQVINFDNVIVDLAANTITRDGVNIHLTPTEFRLLTILITNPGKVLTQAYLLTEVWGPSKRENSEYLRIYMGHIRQKLEVNPARPDHFITENGVGYRFV